MYYERTHTATCWIASEASKNYSVCFKLDGDIGGDIASNLVIDGDLRLDGRFRLANSKRRHDWVEIAGMACDDGDRPFMFATIETRGGLNIYSVPIF